MRDITISARVPEELGEQIDHLAAATNRNRSWILEQALRTYIEEQSWQVGAIKEALEDYKSGSATLVTHDQVVLEMEELEAEIKASMQQ